jgi:DNA repair ATPase RecN
MMGGPLRADHRFIEKLMHSILAGKVEHVPEEFDLISLVFQKAGGSWRRVFQGSPADISLLKKVMKRAFALNRLTKKYNWNPNAPSETNG